MSRLAQVKKRLHYATVVDSPEEEELVSVELEILTSGSGRDSSAAVLNPLQTTWANWCTRTESWRRFLWTAVTSRPRR